jgi:hypothetical protein
MTKDEAERLEKLQFTLHAVQMPSGGPAVGRLSS